MIIGIGTDIVEISRIRDMIERHGDHFVDRTFCTDEIAYCNRFRDPAARFAGRWAAKEAVVKVLGTGFVKGIGFHDVCVVPEDSGRPQVILTGGAQEEASKLGIGSVMISISHCREHATATAIGIGNS